METISRKLIQTAANLGASCQDLLAAIDLMERMKEENAGVVADIIDAYTNLPYEPSCPGPRKIRSRNRK